MNAPSPSNSPWVVLKFGGTSVSSVSKWEVIAAVVRARLAEGLRPVVVHSAVSGISNRLITLLDGAVRGEHEPILAEIEETHRRLGSDLGLDAGPLLRPYLEEVNRLAVGISLMGEYSPRAHARVLAIGELMATTLGHAYLERSGVESTWIDARTVLVSQPQRNQSARSQILSADCAADADPGLGERFAALSGIIITQGFIARDVSGGTVLLGRGGSDTSAAYLAARLQARRLEIWTDVPGLFTADPRIVPSARLLRALDFDEAQEIATTGSVVLHPKCLPAVRAHRIPVHIRSTFHPDREGTVISPRTEDRKPTVKAISVKRGVVLISMETLGMWHQVGFLAEAFQCFSRNGLSIDLVSTSETNVTASLDAAANALDPETLQRLIDDLAEICKVEVISPCAALSLVGRHIRAILHQLGPALEVFQEQQVHLVSQAANDLNFTFVVDADRADRMVERLHTLMMREAESDPAFGGTWEQLFTAETPVVRRPIVGEWWRAKRTALLEIADTHPAAYVYDRASIERAAQQLAAMASVDRIFYAVKANWHPDVLACIEAAGIGFECVSAGELAHISNLFPDLDRTRLLFTPNFAPEAEYVAALERGTWLTLDNLYPLQQWPERFAGTELIVRVDPGQGRGHDEKVRTAGLHSKFGVPLSELDELRRLVEQTGATVVGLHAHSGSGILSLDHWCTNAAMLLRLRERFPTARVFNIGGGLGVPERPDQSALDLEAIDQSLRPLKAANPDVELWLEPGRFLVAQAGVLLTRVTQTKGKGHLRYVGVNTGMNSLIRPALYGAYHPIYNLTRLDEEATEVTHVVGPICETGDRLGVDHLLPPCCGGDVLLIGNAGAYGAVMSSRYNLREPAVEVAI